MTENIDFKSRAGKKLLKICMGDLYPNPMVVYREYVQNACDALQEAEQKGLFDKNVEKTVSIEIKSNSITIHDRGIGVRMDDVISSLIDLSFSQKSGNRIGRYGIGRLTGAKYCDELVFETSANGEDKKSIVRFNARKARDIISSDKELQCTDVVDMVTTFNREAETPEAHYFRVTMNNVFEKHLLDENDVKQYLSETVPVDFSLSFKSYLLNPAYEEYPEFKDLYKQQPCCNVILNGDSLKKRYEIKVTNSINQEERIGKIHFFKLEDEENTLAWGWYAMTVTAKQFITSVPFRKIRLRQLNMAVGDMTYFDNLYKKDADSSYFIGEIYTIHPLIEPTTGREGLVDNQYKKIFERKVKELFERLNKEYNELSKFGSQVLEPLTTNIRLIKIAKKAVDVNFKTAEEVKEDKDKNFSALNNAKEKCIDYVKKIRKNGRITDLLDGIVEYYQELSDSEIEKYNNKKDVQKSNATISKFNISKEIEKIIGDKDVSKPTQNPVTDTDNVNHKNDITNDESEGQSIDQKGNQRSPSEFDAYKGLTSLERAIVKKVYKILDSQKDLAPSIREKIKAKMVKKLTKNK